MNRQSVHKQSKGQTSHHRRKLLQELCEDHLVNCLVVGLVEKEAKLVRYASNGTDVFHVQVNLLDFDPGPLVAVVRLLVCARREHSLIKVHDWRASLNCLSQACTAFLRL